MSHVPIDGAVHEPRSSATPVKLYLHDHRAGTRVTLLGDELHYEAMALVRGGRLYIRAGATEDGRIWRAVDALNVDGLDDAAAGVAEDT